MGKRVLSNGSFFSNRPNVLTRVRSRKMRIGLALASVVAAIAGSIVSAPAQTLTWDPTFAPTSPLGGAGIWDLTTSTNWSNATTDFQWTDNSAAGTDVAMFTGTGGAVTLNNSLSAMGLVFNVPGYSISGSSVSVILKIGSSGINASSLTSGTTNLSNSITLAAAQNWTVGTGSNLVVSGPVVNGGFLLTLPGAGNTSISGIISGTGGIANTGTGTLTLGGANTFSGGVTLNTGTVIGNNATAFGSSVGTFVLGNAGATSTATVLGGSFAFANKITVVAGDTFTQTIGNTSGANATFSGAITLNNPLTLTETGATGALTITGVITGSSPITINSDPAGVTTGTTGIGQVSLGVASPAFTGTYSINTGALRINGETNSANQVFVASGAMLDLIGAASTIKELSGSGIVGISNSAGTARILTLGGTGNSTFSGVIRNNVANNAATAGLTIALTGGGIQTLSGADTYSGPTLISSGTLNLANANALQNTTVTINVANGLAFTTGIGTFNIGALSGSANQTFIDSSAAAAATLSVGADNASTTYSGILSDGSGSVHGKLIKVGTGVLTVGNTTIAYTGGTTIAGGGLAIPSSTVETFLVTNGLAMTGGFLQYNYNATPAAGVTSLAHVGLGAGSGFTVNVGAVNLSSPTFGGAGSVALGASTTISGPTTFMGGTLVYPTGDVTDLTAFPVTLATGGGTLFTNNNLSFANPMSGVGGFTKAGTGTVTINAANTYAGDTSITGGVLLLNTPNALTTTGTVFVLVNNGLQVTPAAAGANPLNLGGLSGTGNLSLNDTSTAAMNVVAGFNGVNTTYSGIMSGAGSFTKVGTGTLVVTNNLSNFTGNVSVNGGVLSVTSTSGPGYIQSPTTSGVGDPSILGRTVTVNNGGILSFDASSITGGGNSATQLGVVVNTGGLFRVTTANDTIGNITLNGGNILDNGNAAGQYSGLELNGSVTVTGTTPVTISGTGGLSLTVNQAAGAQTTFDVGVTSGVGPDLTITASIGNSGASQNAAGIMKIGLGTLALNAANIYTGLLSISSGTVLAFGTNAGVLGAAGAGVFVDSAGTLDMYGTTAATNSNFTYTMAGAMTGSGVINIAAPNTGTSTAVVAGNLSGFTGVINILPATGGNGKTQFTGAAANVPSSSAIINVQSGTTLYLAVAAAYGNTFNLYGAGNSENLGALRIEGPTLNGNVVLFGSSSIGDNAAASTINGIISENTPGMSLTKLGSGIISLTATETYTGNTTITGGTLQLGNSNGTGQLSLTSTIIDNGTFSINRNTNVVQGIDFSGSPISSTGTIVANFTQTGTGATTLNVANTYTGITNILNGTLVGTNSQAFGSSTINFGAATVNAVLDLQYNTDTTAYSVESNTGGIFTIATDVNSPGAGINHSLGNASLGGGLMSIIAGVNVNSGTGTLTLASLGLTSGTTNAVTTINPGIISVPVIASIGNISIIGTFVNKTLDLDGNTSGNVVTGVISNGVGAQALSIIKSGSSDWTLLSANTYSGSTSITGGKLILGNANAVSASTVFVTTGNGLVFASSVGTFNLGGLGGNSGITMAATNSTAIVLSVGANNSNTSFDGSLNDGGVGSSLVKVGTGTLTLTQNSFNSFSGGTTVSAGVLAITNDYNVNYTTPVIGASGTLQFVNWGSSLTFPNNPHLSLGAAIGASSNLNSGAISGTSNLTYNGPGVLILNGTQPYIGGTTITGGVLQFALTSTMPATGDVTVNTGAILGVNVGGSGEFTIGGSGAGSVPGLLAGIISTGTFPAVGVGGSGANVTIQAGAAIGLDTSNFPGTFNFVPSSLGSNVAAFNFAKLGGNTWLFNDPNFKGAITAISPTGLLQLDDANAVSAGTLGVSSMVGANAAGTNEVAFTSGIGTFHLGGLAGNGNLSMVDVASQTVNLAIGGTNLNSTYSGVLSGSGKLTKDGTGTFVVSGASSFTGDVTVNLGKLSVTSTGNNNTSGLGATNIAGRFVTINAGIVSLDANGTIEGNGAATPQLGFVINAGGALDETSGNTPIGPIFLNGGTINTTGGNGAGNAYPSLEFFAPVTVGGTSASTITGTGFLALGGFGAGGVTTFNVGQTGAGGPDLTVSAVLAWGAGATTNATGLLKTGLGTMDLTAANAFLGAATVSQGTLLFNGANGSATAATSFVLYGGSLVLDNTTASGGNNANRLNNAATVILSGGTLVYKGSDAANSIESIGAISGSGNSTITLVSAGFSATLSGVSTFAHTAGNGTDLVNGVGLGKDGTSATGRIILTTAPTLTGTTNALATGDNAASKNTKIVPFLVGEATTTTTGVGTASGVANTFVTYSTASGTFVSGLRPLNPTDEFTNNAITAGNNIYLTTATSATATAAINSLVVNGGDLSINDGANLTDTSGALLFVTSNAIKPTGTTGIFTLGAEGEITTNANVNATLSAVLAGGQAVTKSGAGTLWLTGANNTTGVTTVTDGVVNVSGVWATQANGIVVGTEPVNAVLNVLPGANISRNSLLIGNGTGAVGVVNQSGGILTNAGNTSITYGVNSYGYYKMSAGVINNTGEFQINGANSSGTSVGIFDMSGGTLNAASWVQVSRSTGTGTPYALLNLTGGVFNLTGSGTNLTMTDSTNGGATGTSVINIANATIQGANNNRALVMANSGAGGRTDVVNLLSGGLLSIYQVTAGNAAPTAIFNFNGGTLQAEGSAVNSGNFMTSGNMDAVNVFGAGGTVDNNSRNITIGNSLLAPSGNGLSSFNLTSGGAGYVGAPYVTFVGGGGVGATGYAVMSGGVVTSVVITSPGTGYTSPATVLFTGGGYSTPAVATVGMVANISGGMAFIGSGTTTLSGNNTYTGSTSITAGTVLLTGSFSGTSNVNVTNSTLNVSGSINATNDVTAGAGGKIISNGGGSINAGTGITINGAGASIQAAANAYVPTLVNLINGSLVGSSGSTFTAVTVSDSASNILSNDFSTPGSTFNINSLTFLGQASLNLAIAGTPTTPPVINVSTLTTAGAGKITINAAEPAWAPGIYDILGDSTVPTLSDFTKGLISGLSNRQTSSLVLDPANNNNLAIQIVGSNTRWSGIIDGQWTTSIIPPDGSGNKNWAFIGAVPPNGADFINGDISTFDDSATGTTALTITGADVQPTTVIFNNSNLNYSISNASLFGIADFVASAPTTFILNGTGTVTISNANTYSGGTTLNAGTLDINNASAIGSGKLVIAANTALDNTSGSAVTLSANNLQTWNTPTLQFNGSNDLNMGTGTVTIFANETVNTDGTGNLSVGGISGGAFYLNKTGTGTFTVNGPSTFTGSVTVNAGVLSINGATAYTGVTLVNGGVLNYNGISTTDGNVTVSGGGKMNIGGSMTGNSTTANVLIGNTGGNAVMTVTGTLTKNNFILGSVSGAAAALYLSGSANVTATQAASTADFRIGNAAGAFGYVNIGTGSILNVNESGIGGSDGLGNGLMEVSGGTFNDTGWITMNRNGGSGQIGILDVSGGLVKYAGSGIVSNFGTNGTVVLNVTGGKIITTNNTSIQLATNNVAGNMGQLNLLGGVVQPSSVVGGNLATTSLNFNGGTLRANANQGNFIAVTAAYVYGNGGTIDSNGFNVTVGQNLLAPTGNGISAADYTVDSGGSGYISPPIVLITGDGTGATAVAAINGAGVVTGITITNPGVNYSNFSFSITGGGGSGADAFYNGSGLTPNVATGGMTFAGSGVTTFSSTGSTYQGATTVTGGKLVLSGAISSTSGFTIVSGGRLSATNATIAVAPVVTVNSGGTIDGTGTVNTVFVNAGGNVANGNGGVGVLTVNNLTFNASGSLSLIVDSPQSSVGLFVNHFTTGGNAVTVNASKLYGLGYNDLVAFGGGTFSGVLADFVPGSLGIARQTAALVLDPANGDLALNVTALGSPLLWTAGTSGVWNNSSGILNWKFVSDGTPIDFIPNDTVAFDDTASSGSVTIGTSNVSPISATFNNNTLNYTVAGAFGISGPGQVIKSGTGTVTISTANSYTGGTIVNNGSLTMSASNAFGNGFVIINGGTATLSAANTYTGGTTVNGGLLNIGNANALGTGPLVMNGGSYDNTSGSATTLGGNIAQSWSGSNTFVGSNSLNMGTGSITLNGPASSTVTFTVAANTLTTGLINSPGSNGFTAGSSGIGFTLVGPGTLYQSNTNNTTAIAGLTNIASGTLQIAGDFYADGGLTGAGVITNPSATAKWLYVTTGADTTFSGNLVDGVSRVGLAKVGTGTLTMTGTSATGDILDLRTGGIVVSGGSLLVGITGTGTGATQVGTTAGQGTATLTVNNGGTLTAASTANFTVGGATGTYGVLNINNGTVNALKTSAPSIQLGAGAGFSGEINMTGGILNATSEIWLSTADGGYGVLNQSGGVLTSGSWLAVSRGGGSGVINLSGTGSIIVNTNQLTIGSSVGGTPALLHAVVNASGNSIITANGANGIYVAELQSGVLTVSDNAQVNVTTTAANQGLEVAVNAGITGIINLNGGVTTARKLYGGAGTSIANFNGGTLRGTGVTNGAFLSTQQVYIYGGGATFDDSGVVEGITTSLSAPTGNGITAAGLTVTGTGFLGTPIIQITDATGTGATAVAQVDASGNLTGIVITSPGINYTSPTFTIAGGGAAAVGSITGTDTLVDNTLSHGGITKIGAGTLTLAFANTYTGGTTINAGTISSAFFNLPAAATGAAVTLNPGGTYLVPAVGTAHVTPVTTSNASYFAFAGGKLNLSNNDAIITSGAASELLAGKAMPAPVLTVTGSGSLQVTTGVLTGAEYTAMTGLTSFDSVAFASTDLLFRYGMAGDVSFNGKINLDDYLAIDRGYSENLAASYFNGDFNHDGTINAADYALIDYNYLTQSGTLANGEISSHTQEFGAAYTDAFAALSSGASAVPEPASLAVLGLGAVGLLTRRRRRQR